MSRRSERAREVWATVHAARSHLRHQARTSTSFGGAREHLAGLRLAPIGTDTMIGSGLPVQGSALTLLLAISGRDVAFTDLEGAGAADLVRRLRP